MVHTAVGPHRNLRIENNQDDDDSDQELIKVTQEEKECQRRFLEEINSNPESDKFRKEFDRDVIRSKTDLMEENMPSVDIKGLLGRTFITDPDEDGEQHRAKVVEAHATGDNTSDGKDAILRFKCEHGDHMFEEVMSHNKMLEWCDRDLDKDDMHRIEAILGHRKVKGQWELLIKWASGTSTWNPFGITYTDDPVSASIYAWNNNLLDTPGWC